MAIIPQTFLESVVSIGVRNTVAINWIGTGFLVVKPVAENKYQPFLITNKHVLEKKNSVVIRMRKSDTHELVIVDVPLINNGELLYSCHPDNNVDIAAVLIVGGYLDKNMLSASAFNIDSSLLTSQEVIEKGGGEGTGIFMLGFPMGLVNTKSMAPICRSGCIARIDTDEIRETKNMLLDIQNFPGNSGSPIITHPEIVSIDGTKALSMCALIGIVHAYIPYQEKLINSQTGCTVEIRSENSGIAMANPAEYIKETVEIEMARIYSKPISINGEAS